MRKRTLVVGVSVVATLALASLAFFAGVYLGAFQLVLMDSSAKASLLVSELKLLRASDVEKLIGVKEV